MTPDLLEAFDFISGDHAEEQPVMALHICLDEGGKPQGPCVSYCGWVADTPRRKTFEQEWRLYLKERRICFIHMAELMGRDDKPYQDRMLTRQERLDVATHALKIANQHAFGAFIAAVDCAAFTRLSQEAKRKCGTDAHVFCFQQCMRLVVKMLENIRVHYGFAEGWGKGSVFVFDDNHEYAVECYRLLSNAREQHPLWRKWVGSVCFADDEIYTPLQAADMLAWLARQIVKGPDPRMPSQYSSVQLWNLLRLGTDGMFRGEAIHSAESFKFLDSWLKENSLDDLPVVDLA